MTVAIRIPRHIIRSWNQGMSLYEEHLEAIKSSAIGNTVEEVSKEAKRTGWSIRVMKQDGKNCMGTCDYNPGRINVEVRGGKIVEILGLG